MIRKNQTLLLCLLIFLLSYLSFTFSMRVFQTTDSYPNNFTALNAIFYHRLDLTNLKQAIKNRGIITTVVTNNKGVIYPKTPVIVGLLSVPTFFVLNQYYGIRHLTPQQIVLSDYSQYIGKMSAAFYVALSAVLLFLILRKLNRDTRFSLISTSVYVFATNVFNTASQANWQHGISLFLIMLMIYIFLRNPKNTIVLLICGLITGLIFTIRISNGFYGIFVLTYLILSTRNRQQVVRQLLPYIAGVIAAYLPIFILNKFLDVPYGYQSELFTSLRIFTISRFFQNTIAVLFSFNYGLIFFSPVLILGIFSLRNIFSKKKLTPEKQVLISLLPVLALFIIFTSFWWMWTGGTSLNARLLTESLPIWILLLDYSIRQYHKSVLFKTAFIIFFMISVGFNILTTYFMDWSWFYKYTKAGYQNQIRNAWFTHPSLIEYILEGDRRIISYGRFYKYNNTLIFRFRTFRPSVKQGGIVKLSDTTTTVLQ